jgi:ABC-type amino acid transport substrate-binding protein
VKSCLSSAIALVALVSVVGDMAAVRAADTNDNPLRVCLDENLPPFSTRNGDGGSGFDLLIAQTLAKRLDRRLAVQWYESKLDEDSSSTIEANALLSDGRCDLLAGYPLVKDALGKPGLETARLPDFAGARPADRRRRVTLGALAPTTPYHFAALTVVLSGKLSERRITSLADLENVNVVIEAGTLGDAILMTFDHGRLISHISHVVPGRGELFPRLESGESDATIVPMHRFDAYRLDHSDTRLVGSGYYLPIGFNMGFVGLANETLLIDHVNAAVDDMLKADEPATLALAAHTTYLPPRRPYVLDHLSFSEVTR